VSVLHSLKRAFTWFSVEVAVLSIGYCALVVWSGALIIDARDMLNSQLHRTMGFSGKRYLEHKAKEMTFTLEEQALRWQQVSERKLLDEQVSEDLT